jgi:hypothetical protein
MPRGSNFQNGIEPKFGWNWLTLGGRSDAVPVDRRPVRRAQPAPAPRVKPKPDRPVIGSNAAMTRKLAEHAMKPWWCR